HAGADDAHSKPGPAAHAATSALFRTACGLPCSIDLSVERHASRTAIDQSRGIGGGLPVRMDRAKPCICLAKAVGEPSTASARRCTILPPANTSNAGAVSKETVIMPFEPTISIVFLGGK